MKQYSKQYTNILIAYIRWKSLSIPVENVHNTPKTLNSWSINESQICSSRPDYCNSWPYIGGKHFQQEQRADNFCRGSRQVLKAVERDSQKSQVTFNCNMTRWENGFAVQKSFAFLDWMRTLVCSEAVSQYLSFSTTEIANAYCLLRNKNRHVVRYIVDS